MPYKSNFRVSSTFPHTFYHPLNVWLGQVDVESLETLSEKKDNRVLVRVAGF